FFCFAGGTIFPKACSNFSPLSSAPCSRAASLKRSCCFAGSSGGSFFFGILRHYAGSRSCDIPSSVAADFDYIAYIDETGDTGLKLVQPLDPEGSSEWFMLGAAVISAKRETEVAGWATDLARTAKSRR